MQMNYCICSFFYILMHCKSNIVKWLLDDCHMKVQDATIVFKVIRRLKVTYPLFIF
jgi:hypothetical protein